jgi:hypothetical protein
MIQKVKEYQVQRAAEKSYNSIGEEIYNTSYTFPINLLITVASGNTAYSNLIKTIQSTHTAIFYEGDLQPKDIIIDGSDTYRVDYVYSALNHKIAYLKKDVGISG